MPTLLLTTWYGLAAPAGIKPEILGRVHGVLLAGMQTSEVKERLAKVGIDAVTDAPAEFSQFLHGEVTRWARVIADAGIKLE